MSLEYRFGGALTKNCPWYVERREDQLVFDQLSRGKSCYVLTSHQMGKSSLVVRLVDKLRQAGIASVAIDLAAFGRELSAAQWFHALAQRVGEQLHLEDAFDTVWATHRTLPPAERFANALRQVALASRPEPLIIFIDEVDLLGSLPFSADPFLKLVQSASAPGSASPGGNPLGFCLLGTVSPSGLWREVGPAEAAFGPVIVLRDFARENLWALTGTLSSQLNSCPEICWADHLYTPQFIVDQILDRVFYWTNGHPYLTQSLSCAATHLSIEQLCHADILAVQCHALVDRCCQDLFTAPAASQQDAHLLWIRHRLLGSDFTASQIFDNPRSRPQPLAPEEEAQRWRASGIVRVHRGQIEWRNRIYERVFGGPALLEQAPEMFPAWRRSRHADLRQAHASALGLLKPGLQAALCA
jgi:hypothetical protein